MSLNIELFISEIEKRPELYNTKLKKYSNKNFKEALWNELCEIFIDKWNELGDKEKNEKGNELRKKWKNLRTCFKREYDTQKKELSGSANKKRRRYIYYEQLLFLRDSIESIQTSNNLEESSEDEMEIDIIQKIDNKQNTEELEDGQVNVFPTRPINKPTNQKKVPQISLPQITFEESLLEILSKKRDEEKEIDEDKYFLLSLLPSFKKFNEDQKFVAKIEIMNAIRKVRLSENSSQ